MTATFALRYSPRFGLRPNNLISREQASEAHQNGREYAIVFGEPANPHCFAEIARVDHEDVRHVVVDFLTNLESARVYFLETNPQMTGRADLLLLNYHSKRGNDGPRFYNLSVSDVYVDGDLPTLTFDQIGNRGESHAISVPVDDFFLGPSPDFEELASGRFLDRLPKITLPPKNLWTDYIPQSVRTPATPKRTPIGRFPW